MKYDELRNQTVESCDECYYLSIAEDDSVLCTHDWPSWYMRDYIPSEIPTDCPLPDAEQEQSDG